MKKHIKTLLCLAIVAIFALFGGIMSINSNNNFAGDVSAQETPAQATLTENGFTIDDTTGIITAYSGLSSSVNIPATIGGVTVTGIGPSVFSGKTIYSVYLPSTCTSIGNNAFYNCTNLRNINSSQNITSIGDYAFYNCKYLSSIPYLHNVTTIGNYAFYGCENLSIMQTLSALTSLGQYAFAKCTSLQTIEMPQLQTIPAYAFTESTILYFYLFSQLRTIEQFAFFKCKITYLNQSGSNSYFEISSYGGWTSSYGTVKGLVTRTLTGIYSSRTLVVLELGKPNIELATNSSIQYYGPGVFAGGNFYSLTINSGTYNLYGEKLSEEATFHYVYYNASSVNSITTSSKSPFNNASIKHLEISSNTTTLPRYSFYYTQIDEIRISSSDTTFDSSSIYPEYRENKSFYVDNLILEYEADSTTLTNIQNSGLFRDSLSSVCSIYFIKTSLIYLGWPTSSPWSNFSKLGTFTKDNQEYLVYSRITSTATIVASAGSNGSISPAGTTTVPMYDTVRYTITPSSVEYKISDVKVNGVSQGSVSTIDVYADQSNITISATFAIKTFSVVASAGTGGTISPTGTQTVEYGASITFIITPNQGYQIKDVKTGTYSANTSQGAISEYTFENITTSHRISATFEKIPYIITASAGEGGAISPSGEVTVLHGNSRVFTITPNTGYEIDTLTVDGQVVESVSVYTFTNVINVHSISVTFKKIKYTITVVAGSNGSISPSGSVSVEHGDNKTFTITPNTGYQIDQLKIDGNVVTSALSYTFENITANHTIEVSFKLLTYTITVTSGENGSISPTGPLTVNYGSSQTFTITPNTGYKIKDVVVDNSSKGSITTFTFSDIKENHSISAIFEIITFTITTSAGTGGSISPNGVQTVNYGSDKTFAITPSTGYKISDVKVNGTSVGAVSTYTFQNITSNQTISATFEKITYTITAIAGSNGSISPSGTVDVEHGNDKTFTFTPNTGYVIKDVKVDNVSVGKGTSYTIRNVTSNKTIFVEFELEKFVITATSDENGTISPSGSVSVEYGTNKTFTITPNTGYLIEDVKVDGQSVGAVASYAFENITANHSIDVTFKIQTFTITATAGTGGSITPSGTKNVNYGASQTYTITPSTGYEISDVKVDGTSKGKIATYTFTNVIASHTISVTFTKIIYTITIVAGENGSISPSGSVSVEHGSSKTFTITANTGYAIKDVFVDGQSVGAVGSYTIQNVTKNMTISAEFEKKGYTITATAGEGGDISPKGNVNVLFGNDQTFEITPSTGYEISDVVVDNQSVGLVSSYTFEDVGETHTISVTFEKITYTITASAGTGGSISPNGNVAVEYGEDKTFEFVADLGYQIKDVLVDGQSVGALESYTILNITDNMTISVEFEQKSYEIFVISGANGNITPSDNVTVLHGGEQTFEIAPNIGYEIADVLVDGQSVGAIASYTFESVTKSHTIEVTFKVKTFTIIATAGEGGSISPSGEFTKQYNEDQSFVITPDQGYKVKKLLSNGFDMGAPSTYGIINIQEDYTIFVEFEKISHIITATAGTGGSISPNGEQTVEYGNDKTFTITPNTGYEISDVVVDGQSVGAVASYTFESVTNVHTISATFEKIKYTITVICGEHGTITPQTEQVEHGSSISFVITANINANIADVKVDGQSIGAVASYAFENVTANHTIEAIFVQKTEFAITINCDENGSITPNDITTIAKGSSQIFAISANQGYVVKEVRVNGIKVLVEDNKFTVQNVQTDTHIEVSFEKQPQAGDITTLIIIFAVVVLAVSGVVIFFVIKSTKIKKLEK